MHRKKIGGEKILSMSKFPEKKVRELLNIRWNVGPSAVHSTHADGDFDWNIFEQAKWTELLMKY